MMRRFFLALTLGTAFTGFWARPALAIIGPCNDCSDDGPASPGPDRAALVAAHFGATSFLGAHTHHAATIARTIAASRQ